MYLHVLFIGVSLIGLSPAFAENCEKLDKNKNWVSEFNQLNDDFQRQDWNSAINHAKNLEKICSQSPILNYMIAHIHKSQGDDEKYLFYLQKSTQNTERFSVDKDMLDKMWSEKYIAVHPEAAPENIKALKDQLESYKSGLETQKQVSTSVEDNHIDDYKTTMWFGTGIGAGGLVLGGVGAVILVKTDPILFKNNSTTYTENPAHILGWTLVGVGSALTIVGTILAGIYGYKYKQAKDNQTLSFTLTPFNTSLSIRF